MSHFSWRVWLLEVVEKLSGGPDRIRTGDLLRDRET